MRVIVHVKNGVVSKVITDDKSIEVLVLDEDTDGLSSEDTIKLAKTEYALETLKQGIAVFSPEKVSATFDKLPPGLLSKK